jgi:hypothetical protein
LLIFKLYDSFPLHDAIKPNAPNEVIAANKDSANKPDQNDDLPLHSAIIFILTLLATRKTLLRIPVMMVPYIESKPAYKVCSRNRIPADTLDCCTVISELDQSAPAEKIG